MREEIALAPIGDFAGSNSKTAISVYLDNDKVDNSAYHVLQHIIRSFLPLLPHF